MPCHARVMSVSCRCRLNTLKSLSQHCAALLLLLQDEVRQLLMRKSSTFARGASKYRGVTKHKVPSQPDISEQSSVPDLPPSPATPKTSVIPDQVHWSLPPVYFVLFWPSPANDICVRVLVLNCCAWSVLLSALHPTSPSVEG